MRIGNGRLRSQGQGGVTLIEVVMSMAIGGLIVAGVATGFIQCMRQAEWSSYSLAANSLAMQRMEQTRAGVWDQAAGIDQVKDPFFPAEAQILDIPINQSNIAYATNYTTITTVSTNPPLRMVRVDTVWRCMDRGPFTNTIVTYRAPDT